jgi:hypothetical protein
VVRVWPGSRILMATFLRFLNIQPNDSAVQVIALACASGMIRGTEWRSKYKVIVEGLHGGCRLPVPWQELFNFIRRRGLRQFGEDAGHVLDGVEPVLARHDQQAIKCCT